MYAHAVTDDTKPSPTDLSPEQKEKVRQWLTDHWTTPACPFHGPTTWQIGGIVGQISGYSKGALVLGGQVYPSIVLICNQCGYEVLINAIRAGIVEADKPEETETEKPSETTRDE